MEIIHHVLVQADKKENHWLIKPRDKLVHHSVTYSFISSKLSVVKLSYKRKLAIKTTPGNSFSLTCCSRFTKNSANHLNPSWNSFRIRYTEHLYAGLLLRRRNPATWRLGVNRLDAIFATSPMSSAHTYHNELASRVAETTRNRSE